VAIGPSSDLGFQPILAIYTIYFIGSEINLSTPPNFRHRNQLHHCQRSLLALLGRDPLLENFLPKTVHRARSLLRLGRGIDQSPDHQPAVFYANCHCVVSAAAFQKRADESIVSILVFC
jgi:hypothetical protein